MKKVLITGMNGYIGKEFEKWINRNDINIKLDFISVRNKNWEIINFFEYDSILHLAGIVHDSNATREEYFRINEELTISLAEKAKKNNVKQFIFLSTMNVFGIEEGNITLNTKINPVTDYGVSKLNAETNLLKMRSGSFNVSIVRPPVVYGNKSPGNFSRLIKLSKLVRLFPEIYNQRSMIYIDNLCNFLYLLIKNNENGIFHPQNNYYVSTAQIIKEISKSNRKKIFFTNKFNYLLKQNMVFSKSLKKMFGNLTYDVELSKYSESYSKISFEDSIVKTLQGDNNEA